MLQPHQRARKRDLELLRKYGINAVQYESMLHSQGGRCAICRLPPAQGRRLHVDHCHDSKRVRSLLCINCNQGIGKFRDSPDLLLCALGYLHKHNSTKEAS